MPALAAGTSTAKTAPASTIQPTTPTAGPVDIQRLDASPKARKAATALLLRAVEQLASNDQEWQHASAVKGAMRQLDPVFQEGSLGTPYLYAGLVLVLLSILKLFSRSALAAHYPPQDIEVFLSATRWQRALVE